MIFQHLFKHVQAYVLWPFQDPRLEVPTIYKAYFLGLHFREYPPKIWPNIWYSTSILGSWRYPFDMWDDPQLSARSYARFPPWNQTEHGKSHQNTSMIVAFKCIVPIVMFDFLGN